MTDFSAAMAAPSRTLSIRATLTLATGYAYSLTGDDILAYSLNEGASGGSMLLGSALSAYATLSLASPNGAWRPGGSKLGNRTLMGATAQIDIGVLINGEFFYAPAGSFIVSRVESAEGEDTVTLSGYDQLLHLFSPIFSDSLTYPCTLQTILQSIAAQAGCSISGTPLCNAKVTISAQPDWGESCTLRQALAWVCGAMGCFARLSRSGDIALIPLKATSSRALSAQNALSLTLEDTLFTFNRLRVMPRKGKEYVQAALNSALPYSADNTLTIDDNPLFRFGSSELTPLCNNLCQALAGLSFTPFSMVTTGDPTLAPGDFFTLTDLRGNAHPALIFSHQLSFADGLSARLSCDLDSSGVSLPRIVTSSGTLSSAALTDGIIAARHIAAGAIDAEKISARSITADQIALGAITSASGVIGQLNADNITAGKLSTDRLIVGGSEFSIVRALNQLANSMSQNDSTVDGGVLSDKSISANKVTDDFGAGLELSSNAAVLVLAGKLDGSHSHMELTQDAINMVGGEINIATNDLQIRGMDDGGEIMSLDPEGLSAKRVTVTEDFSAPNIVYSHPGKTAAWKGSVQKSIDALPKYLTQDTTLTIPAGVYAEDVNIRGFYGSMLRLLFAPGATLNGSVSVRNCSHVVIKADTLGDAHIYPRSKGDGTVNFYAVTRAQISNMYISGYRGRTTADNGSDIALYLNSCHALVENCCLEYANKGLSSNYSVVYAENTFGGAGGNDPLTNANLTYGILASSGSHVYVVGDYPLGGKANTGEYRGVLSPYSLGDATPGGMEYVAPVQYVRSFAISKHCTYLYGVSRKRDDQTSTFSQGYYGTHAAGENNWRIGAMWFADAAEALQGKTILSAQLTLRRASGGWSNAVGVYLGTVALPEDDFTTTLKPAFTSATPYPIGTLKRETEATYDVTSLISAIQAGHAIGVYEPRSSYSDNWSPAYTNFYGKGSSYEPVLTVTYK